MKAQHRDKEDEEVVARESKPRGIFISKEDLTESRYGPNPGCRGCAAANRGDVGLLNERCRSRIEGEIMKNDPGRYDRVLAKLVKHEEQRRRKRPTTDQQTSVS